MFKENVNAASRNVSIPLWSFSSIIISRMQYYPIRVKKKTDPFQGRLIHSFILTQFLDSHSAYAASRFFEMKSASSLASFALRFFATDFGDDRSFARSFLTVDKYTESFMV